MNTRTYNAIRSIQARFSIPLSTIESPESWVDENHIPILPGGVAADIRYLLTVCELTDGPQTYRDSFLQAWAEDNGCIESFA